jgi:hypothetical protein
MIDSSHHSNVTPRASLRAGSKVRARCLALLLPGLILMASAVPLMATPVSKAPTPIENGPNAKDVAVANPIIVQTIIANTVASVLSTVRAALSP